uniref:Transcriptional enhancer factor TEF-3 n=1 Tax=Nothoprocta perdicaria TaxID=30464 RepID=A0A8C6ZEL1_NOTPE
MRTNSFAVQLLLVCHFLQDIFLLSWLVRTVGRDQAAKDKAMQSMATMSSAQIISATAIHSKMGLPGLPRPAYPAVSGVNSFIFLLFLLLLSISLFCFYSVKPFSQQPYAVQLPLPGFEPPTGLSPSPSAPAWQGRRVASSKLWMLEFSAFLEQQQDQDTYNKHLFVHIGQSSPSYNDPYLEAVDIRQIYDKFPEKKGGLKELFEKGPANAFFLVKFWVRDLLCRGAPVAGYPITVKFLLQKSSLSSVSSNLEAAFLHLIYLISYLRPMLQGARKIFLVLDIIIGITRLKNIAAWSNGKLEGLQDNGIWRLSAYIYHLQFSSRSGVR